MKLLWGVHSTHLSWKFGLWYEKEKLGGMAVHYGHPANTWLILLAFGHNTYRLGLGK